MSTAVSESDPLLGTAILSMAWSLRGGSHPSVATRVECRMREGEEESPVLQVFVDVVEGEAFSYQQHLQVVQKL
jgi:hypothetical protein